MIGGITSGPPQYRPISVELLLSPSRTCNGIRYLRNGKKTNPTIQREIDLNKVENAVPRSFDVERKEAHLDSLARIESDNVDALLAAGIR